MGSTFWAVSYFRSLKRINVLPLLTKYLLQYKRVCIPHIGTFELVQQPPRLDVADKHFSPPFFTTTYISQQQVPDHQLHFLCADGLPRESARAELFSFGEALKNRIRTDAFRWNGFGSLHLEANEVVFEPQSIRLESLQQIQAEKVMRKDATHNMLVGDKETTNTEMITSLAVRKKRGSLVILIGWILALLALIAVIVILYLGKFQTTASGMHSIIGRTGNSPAGLI